MVHLQPLLLRSQRVDDAYPSGLGGQPSHLVAPVVPPGRLDVAGPVGARPGRRNVDKATPRRVVAHAVCQWVDECQHLHTGAGER